MHNVCFVSIHLNIERIVYADDLNDELREYGRLMIITTFSLIDIP